MQISYLKGQGSSEKFNESPLILFKTSMKNKTEKVENCGKQPVIQKFLYFPLSPKEKSRHTVFCMEQAWLYQFVDFRRDQRPTHGLTFIQPYNAPSLMEYCHAHAQ